MALTDKLTAIANAIRTKTDKTDLLTLDDMPTEIENIKTGDTTIEDGLVTGTLTEYSNDRVTSVRSYALANCKTLEKVVLPMVQTLPTYALAYDTELKHIDILGGGTLSGTNTTSCLLECINLTEVIMRNSKVTQLSALLFPHYTGKITITRNFTRALWNIYGAVGSRNIWTGAPTLITGSISYFTGTVTDEASKPVWLFIEYLATGQYKTLAFVETEEDANALMLQYDEWFKNEGCKFYVPSALVEEYKSAPNWSTYAEQIRAIEDYPEITV